MMVGTCGHEVNMQNVKDGLLIKEYTGGLQKCTAAIVVCSKCRQGYEDEGLVLHNKAEELEWINE